MRRVKKLKIMVAGLAITLAGYIVIKHSDFSFISCQTQKDAILTFDEVIPNSPYFHKSIHDKVTLSDIILTSAERGICENETRYYQQIIQDKWIDSFALQQLHIEENLSSAFLSFSVTRSILNHKNHQLYDQENNDIYWDKVSDIWYMNTLERVKLDKMYKDFPHSKNLYLDLSCLEKDKIQALVSSMKEFIDSTKEQIPNLDMKRVACQLAEFSFCYTNYNYSNALLVSDNFTLLFPNTLGVSQNLETMKKDLFHEFKHMLATPCDDEVKNQMFYPSQTGIYTMSSDFPKEENRNSYTWYYLPFDWIFLEEAGAESFSSELLNLVPTTYQVERTLEQDLLFSISLLPDFDKNIFVKCSLQHNPIALLQQFPVPNNQEDWIYQNAKMIESYNILSNPQALLNYILNIEQIEGYQNTFKRQNGVFSNLAQDILLSLEDTADLQLFRIFLVNLMNCDKTLTLDDHLYLYRLMDMRIQKHRNDIISYYGIEIDSLYQETKQAYEDCFIGFLKDKFEITNIDYENYSLDGKTLSMAFSEEEKLYYDSLKRDSYNSTLNKENLDKILNYYLGG